MGDDERLAPDGAGAGAAGGDAGAKLLEERARLLEEQQARIAALRAAVLSGRVPDEATFDYARFFGAPADDTPER